MDVSTSSRKIPVWCEEGVINRHLNLRGGRFVFRFTVVLALLLSGSPPPCCGCCAVVDRNPAELSCHHCHSLGEAHLPLRNRCPDEKGHCQSGSQMVMALEISEGMNVQAPLSMDECAEPPSNDARKDVTSQPMINIVEVRRSSISILLCCLLR